MINIDVIGAYNAYLKPKPVLLWILHIALQSNGGVRKTYLYTTQYTQV